MEPVFSTNVLISVISLLIRCDFCGRLQLLEVFTGCWWSVSETYPDLLSLCSLLQQPKPMLLLFFFFFLWCTLRLARLFSCSHLTSHRLRSIYSGNVVGITAGCFFRLIIGLSSSRMLPLLSPPAAASALMFSLSAEPQLAPSLPSLCKRSLHCCAVIGSSAAPGLLGRLSGRPVLLLCCY